MVDVKNNIITVFTPTYNRAYILPQLYNSLKNQTDKSFIWLIVDDGSTDGTDDLVSVWVKEGYIDIKYLKQENAGKMKAHNVGVEQTNTELFVCVDSDDWLLSNSIEQIRNKWEELSRDEKSNTAGFIAYRGKSADEVIGNYFPGHFKKSTLSNLYNQGFRGDTTIVFRSEIIKQYPFPIITGEKFITEAYVYDQIDQKYSYYLIPSIMIVCEYRNDGLTQNLIRVSFNNPCGYTAYFLQKANFSNTIKDKIFNYIRANCFRHKIKNKTMPVVANNKFLYNLTYPFGLLLYLSKKIKYNRAKR